MNKIRTFENESWSAIKITFPAEFHKFLWNKANLRDLIAATGLEILLKFDPNHPFFSPCDLEIWWITSKNNRAPCLYYIKLCASFLIHQWNCSYSPETLNSVKIGNSLSRVTLKLDGWPWKTMWYLFYAASSFVHHFIAINKFKLELQSGNARFGSKSTILLALWPWNLTDDLEKQYGACPKQQTLCIISSSYVNSNWSYSPETTKLGIDLCDLDLWPLILTFCMDVTSVIDNNSWKFDDDTMMGT